MRHIYIYMYIGSNDRMYVHSLLMCKSIPLMGHKTLPAVVRDVTRLTMMQRCDVIMLLLVLVQGVRAAECRWAFVAVELSVDVFTVIEA